MIREKKQVYDCSIKKILDEQRIPEDEVTQLIEELKELLPDRSTREINSEVEVKTDEETEQYDDEPSEPTENPEYSSSETSKGRTNTNE